MNRAGVALGLLLLAQIVLVGFVYMAPTGSQFGSESKPLTRAAYFHIDELRIEDGHGSGVQLTLTDDRWVLPTLGGLPAEASHIEQILQTLSDQNTGWSVAHTLAARQRFQVAHYHFRRKITLLAQGQEVDTVFLGTSPGFRKVHARNDAGNAIYSIPLNLFDVPTTPGAWLARDLLKVRAPLSITADTYTLNRSSGDWLLGTGQTPDPAELDALLLALEHLHIEGVASERTLQEAELIFEIESLTGSTTLELYRQGDNHFVRSSQYPLLFRISSYTFDQLTGINLFM
ncbi:DUF4340 domain-containing protein [Halioglobus maricola]|uniref:DUF4340 domain-containing protein n=1 Tax=Halioglobus maricola TaxID=2601894 RepID=A0A5P9NPR6_9GAMM|nr:DUF4340 domain-containing protein [Halioglobus maricola]QFU77445.1 DUF4340 domain-containing protein [Halioglobus maricola]